MDDPIQPTAAAKSAVRRFTVKFLRYGNFRMPARWQTIEVNSISEKEALRIVKSKYRRAEQYQIV